MDKRPRACRMCSTEPLHSAPENVMLFIKVDTQFVWSTFKCLQRMGSSKRVNVASNGIELAFLAKKALRKRNVGAERERGATKVRYNMS